MKAKRKIKKQMKKGSRIAIKNGSSDNNSIKILGRDHSGQWIERKSSNGGLIID